ncbi:CBL-interacting serine/threonine-protein kinase 23 [Borealophlyctis nickersoniae]|nr:CBL-interacting serine/threonine-protein kinase 23 [Borealophlyctis nickersoniae]
MSFDKLKGRLGDAKLKEKFGTFYGGFKDGAKEGLHTVKGNLNTVKSSLHTATDNLREAVKELPATVGRSNTVSYGTRGRKANRPRPHLNRTEESLAQTEKGHGVPASISAGCLAEYHHLDSLSSPTCETVPLASPLPLSELLELKRQVKSATSEVLGQGGFGRVVKAHLSDGTSVAVKVHERAKHEKPHQFKARVDREVGTMIKASGHPNVIKHYELLEGEKHSYAIMEFASGGSLEDIMLASEGALPLDELQCNFKKLVDVVAHLHARNVVHRDLKPGNVLFDASGTLKLSDFGSAADTTNVIHMLTSFGVTDVWTAPEAAKGCAIIPGSTGHKNGPQKLDVYSIGVLFLLMFWGYEKMDTWITGTGVGPHQFPPGHPAVANLPDAIREFIARALEPDPGKRCGLQEIRDSEWFIGITTCGDRLDPNVVHQHTLQQKTAMATGRPPKPKKPRPKPIFGVPGGVPGLVYESDAPSREHMELSGDLTGIPCAQSAGSSVGGSPSVLLGVEERWTSGEQEGSMSSEVTIDSWNQLTTPGDMESHDRPDLKESASEDNNEMNLAMQCVESKDAPQAE